MITSHQRHERGHLRANRAKHLTDHVADFGKHPLRGRLAGFVSLLLLGKFGDDFVPQPHRFHLYFERFRILDARVGDVCVARA